MNLRRPTERLADCVWLPRLIDKCRHRLAGTLAEDYQFAFCNPHATDGAFLAHFGIDKEELLRAVAVSEGSDQAVVEWFSARSGCSSERIAAWNELAPNLGKEGFPMRRGFLWVLKRYWGGEIPDPRVDSIFMAIAYDEGYIDEL